MRKWPWGTSEDFIPRGSEWAPAPKEGGPGWSLTRYPDNPRREMYYMGGFAVSSLTHTCRVKVPGVPGGMYITYD